MVRISAADPKSLFLLDQKNTDFYEIVFPTDKDCSRYKILTRKLGHKF